MLTWMCFLTLFVGASNTAWAARSDGFDFPLGRPDGVGYKVFGGSGGLAFLERHDYEGTCGIVYHPGEDWNDDNTRRDFGADSEDARDPVFAVSNGTIDYARFHGVGSGWGHAVLIRHDGVFDLPDSPFPTSTVWSWYGHMGSIGTNPRTGQLWRTGDEIWRGEQIGTVGDYRNGDGKNFHLHFEIRDVRLGSPTDFACGKEKSYVESRYINPTAFINLNRPTFEVIFSNFALGDTFAIFNRFGPLGDRAAAFTPRGTSIFGFFLDRVELATSVTAGPNELMVAVLADQAGKPGEIIETFHLSDARQGINVVNSVRRPVLQQGTQYWLVALTPPSPDTFAGWHFNSIGNRGLGACRLPSALQAIRASCGDNVIGPWTTFPDSIMPAFRITGTPIK